MRPISETTTSSNRWRRKVQFQPTTKMILYSASTYLLFSIIIRSGRIPLVAQALPDPITGIDESIVSLSNTFHGRRQQQQQQKQQSNDLPISKRNVNRNNNFNSDVTGQQRQRQQYRSSDYFRFLQQANPDKGLEGTVIKNNFPSPQPDPTPSPSPSFYNNLIPTRRPSMFIPPGLKPSNEDKPTNKPVQPTKPPTIPYTSTSYKDTKTNTTIYKSSCANDTIPVNHSSPIAPLRVSFLYTVSLNDNATTSDHSFLSHIERIEKVLNQQLSIKLMKDCSYVKEYETGAKDPFELVSLSSAPADTIKDTCGGGSCRIVNGQMTANVFYLERRLRQLRFLQDSGISDPSIGKVFGAAIVELFQNHTTKFGSDIAALEFQGITNNAAYDSFGNGNNTDPSEPKDPSVPAIASESSTASSVNKGLGWGASVVALAAVALIAVTVLVVKHKRRAYRNKGNEQLYRGQQYSDDDENIDVVNKKSSSDDDNIIPVNEANYSYDERDIDHAIQRIKGSSVKNDRFIAMDDDDDGVGTEVLARDSTYRSEQSMNVISTYEGRNNQKVYVLGNGDRNIDDDDDESGFELQNTPPPPPPISYKIESSVPPTFILADLENEFIKTTKSRSSLYSASNFSKTTSANPSNNYRSYEAPDTIAL